jgi:hypothetical protein
MAGLLLVSGPSVPQSAPLESAVDTNYERFDGLTYPQGLDMVPVGEGDNYGPTARPGQLQTHGPSNGKPAKGIPGVVGSVGASPLPVADCLHKVDFETVTASPSNPNFRFGPGGAAPGLAQTVMMTEIIQNPPQPEGLSLIFTGA